MKQINHILIIRFATMSNVAISVPLVKALREANPELKISILTNPFFLPFFEGIDNINFILPNLKGKHKGIPGFFRILKEIYSLKVDAIADLQKGVRTRIITSLFAILGKQIATINKGKKERRALTRKFRKLRTPLKSTLQSYQDTLQSLGFDNITLPSTLEKQGREIPTLFGEKTNETWVAYAPFAHHKGKIYPSKLSSELIALLSENFSKVFIFGMGAYEREFGEYMQSLYTNVYSTIELMSLSDEISLISNMDCMISMDSSSPHICSIVGTPVVTVWGATHPSAGNYAFCQNPNHSVSLELECRPCSFSGDKSCRFGDYHCISKISPEKILEKVRNIVKI